MRQNAEHELTLAVDCAGKAAVRRLFRDRYLATTTRYQYITVNGREYKAKVTVSRFCKKPK